MSESNADIYKEHDEVIAQLTKERDDEKKAYNDAIELLEAANKERDQLSAKCAALQRDLKITASNYIRELGAVDKAKEIITAEQEKKKVLVEALSEVSECSQVVLQNAHWEVSFGSGDLRNALKRAKQALEAAQ